MFDTEKYCVMQGHFRIHEVTGYCFFFLFIIIIIFFILFFFVFPVIQSVS